MLDLVTHDVHPCQAVVGILQCDVEGVVMVPVTHSHVCLDELLAACSSQLATAGTTARLHP
jgi:hypothetical protein